MKKFEQINKGFNNTFKINRLSLGVVVPIENYSQSTVPTMTDHIERVLQIEKIGFKVLWVRDVPFNVPAFGDAGQTFDPFTYLGYLAGQTKSIALGVSSIALPLHHPVHIAKSAATIDQLSNGRLILGVASGDRFDEYPAMGINYDQRGELFRENFEYIRASKDSFPTIETGFYGNVSGHIDILPKPVNHKIPLLMTGYSQQSLEWNVKNTDGWMSYPKDIISQKNTINQWRDLLLKTNDEFNKPFMQPLYIDLNENDDCKPRPIHLGFSLGANYLVEYLQQLEQIGVNHVALNLRFNSENIESTLDKLGSKVLPFFNNNNE